MINPGESLEDLFQNRSNLRLSEFQIKNERLCLKEG